MTTETLDRIESIALESISFAVDNHRQSMDEGKLRELADSIIAVGVQQPIKVCRRGDGYAMIFGHRRLKACELAGLDTVPAIVVEDWTDEQIAEAQVIENILREDLNPIEEALCVRTLIAAGNSLEAAASKMNKSLAWARTRLDLLRLERKASELVASGRIPLGHAVLLARMGDANDQRDMAGRVIGRMWNDESWKKSIDGDWLMPLRELRKEIRWKLCKMGSARWPQDVEYAGKRPCIGCPDNTETEPGLFDELKIERTSKRGNCTNPACFAAKGAAWERDPVFLERQKAREEKRQARAEADGEEPGSKKEETYGEREKRIEKLRRRFPWTGEQRYAAALFQYGKTRVEEIACFIETRQPELPTEGCRLRDLVLISMIRRIWRIKELQCPGGSEVAMENETVPVETLAALWRNHADLAGNNQPGIDWDGEERNVPLPDAMIEYIDELENIVTGLAIETEVQRPDRDDMQRQAVIESIVKATKDEALRIIAECGDGVLLADMVKHAESLKLARYKLKAVGQRLAELSSAPSEPAEDTDAETDPTCAICGDHSDVEQAVCLNCYELILHGPKRRQGEVLTAIAKAPAGLIEELKDEKLRGDWRRAAVAKRIQELDIA